MNLKEEIKVKFNIPEDHFNIYESDLHVLFDQDIINYLNLKELGYAIHFSNVEGQAWFGKRFIDIPSVMAY